MNHLMHIVNRAVHMGAEPAVPCILYAFFLSLQHNASTSESINWFTFQCISEFSDVKWEFSLSTSLYSGILGKHRLFPWAAHEEVRKDISLQGHLFTIQCVKRWKSIATHFGRGWGTGLGTTVQHMANLNPYRLWGSLFFFQLQLGELEMSAAESNAFAGRGSYFPLCVCWKLLQSKWSYPFAYRISRGAQYVILHSTIRWRKVKICWFGSGKWFWLCLMVHSVGWPVKDTATLWTCRKRV
jgi:hypothetical protein